MKFKPNFGRNLYQLHRGKNSSWSHLSGPDMKMQFFVSGIQPIGCTGSYHLVSKQTPRSRTHGHHWIPAGQIPQKKQTKTDPPRSKAATKKRKNMVKKIQVFLRGPRVTTWGEQKKLVKMVKWKAFKAQSGWFKWIFRDSIGWVTLRWTSG